SSFAATGDRPRVAIALNSKVDRTKRQKVLDLFFNEFSRIYAPLSATAPSSLAQQHALKQEHLLNQKSASATMYSTLAVPIVNRLKKRALATSITDTGIDGEYKAATVATAPPSINAFESLITTTAELTVNNYPITADESRLHPFGQDFAPRDSGFLFEGPKSCERCHHDFVPPLVMDDADFQACTYHRVRATFQQVGGSGGSKQRIYVCCNGDQSSPGCAIGPHVFKEIQFDALHARIPFTRLPPPPATPKQQQHAVVACDCEMSYTTAGMELTRVSFVDMQGAVIVDELVKTQFPVVDLNSAWSGITSLATAKYTLPQIHTLLYTRGISRDTIIIGHSLENDLCALRIVHSRIIDTSLVFPRRQQQATTTTTANVGVVHKLALKQLCERMLGRRIQVVGNIAGHDSVEDAKAALDLVLFFLQKRAAGVAISY
ncbi:RNA exonuclease 3, partial [Physocladia obscura]